MKYTERPEAVLMLEDGSVFKGYAVGKIGTTGGEICFNTGMTGYQEIYTDPSYYGQIIINTNSHIGNYGTKDTEQESDSVKFNGLVCKSFSHMHSRKIADYSLQEYFEKSNIVGISDVDTRQIVRHIRSKGTMNAIISSEITEESLLEEKLREVPKMEGLELSTDVTISEPYTLGNEGSDLKIAVLDLGIKTGILKNFVERDCFLKVYPAKTSVEDMEEWGADGYFISNGPGDPAATKYAIETVKQLLGKDKPLFGICLGHQLLAKALDVGTYKMHAGHRGLNHPVKNLLTGRSEVTSQNHGFSVSMEDLEKHPDAELTHVNLNDNTVEGLRLKNKKAFSVQYHPESNPGPHDSRYLFDDFIKLINQ